MLWHGIIGDPRQCPRQSFAPKGFALATPRLVCAVQTITVNAVTIRLVYAANSKKQEENAENGLTSAI
jgi:hypothetical protein